MTSRMDRFSGVALTLVLGGALLLSSCGGGSGGSGSGGSGNLVGVSFVGFPTQPSTGANPGVPLPTLFRDEVLEFTFDGPIDDGIMGGFLTDPAGEPIPFTGLAPNSSGTVSFFAYREQSVARSAVEIRENMAVGPLLSSYIVGRSVTNPRKLVVSPRVSASNSFGLPGSVGMSPMTEYTFRFPANSPITVGGNSITPFGLNPLSLPVATPQFSPAPGLSLVWFVGGSFSPDPEPPSIISITSTATQAGTSADPIPPDSEIEVTFSKVIDATSIDPVRNLLVQNLDVTTGGQPTIVPGPIEILERDNRTIVSFSPEPTFGPGVNATTGYTIRVRVGTFGVMSVPQILGQPNGNPPQQLAVPNSLERFFVTAPCSTCLGATSLVETFENSFNRDTTVIAPVNEALWGDPSEPNAGLFATPISGGPLTGFPAAAPTDIGTRSQFECLPTPLAAPPLGLFSPFDDNGTFNLGMTVNPNGGSHIMHLYPSADIGNMTDSVELIEWGPVNNIALAPSGPTTPNTYPSYQAWCGQTSIAAPKNAGTGNGMSSAYPTNYNIPTLQAADPAGFGGVDVSGGPSSYMIPINTFRTFYPFPIFVTPFDYQGGLAMTNLLFEQNIEPGMQTANFNRFRATANVPQRRILGAPLSVQTTGGVMPVATIGGYDIYNMRFTFVSVASSAQSTFYDSGVPTPDYLNLILSPSPVNQPAGTEALWEIQGASAISPAPLGLTPWLTYWSGSPSTGSFTNSAINAIDGKRFVRFRVAMRSNHITNMRQSYGSVLFAVSFGGGQ